MSTEGGPAEGGPAEKEPTDDVSVSSMPLDAHARDALLASALGKLEESILITDTRLELPGPTIVYVNEAFTRMTGYTPEEVIGKTPRILQGPETDRPTVDRLRICLREGRRFEGQTINYRKGGKPFVIRWYIEALRDASSEITHFAAVQRDVTDALRVDRQRRRFEAALDRSPQAVVVLDPRGHILFANPASVALLGRSPEEIASLPIWRSPLMPSRRDAVVAMRRELLAGASWRGEIELRRITGGPRLFELVIVPVADAEAETEARDQPDCFVAIGVDVTRDRRLESIAAAHNFADSVGYVFSGIRHELGNPINSIKAAISLLRSRAEEMEPQRMAQYLERVLGEIGRVEYLLDSLRSFNMFQSPRPEPVAIGPFFDQFQRLVRNDLKKRGIEVLFEAPARPVSIEADARALNQVLLNLVANAIDALETVPQPWLRIRVHATEDHAEISVSDNGCGIADENLDDIFKPFYTSKQGGSGLGLAISRKLLSQMGGVINVASRLERGTTFSMGFERSPEPRKPGSS